MQMKTPQWQWTWNLNTLVILFGFATGLAAWGATWERVNTGQKENSIKIERLDTRMTSVEMISRQLDNHELRIANVERRATEAADAMRTVEAAINSLASDIRVTREIVQRIEQAQATRGQGG
ncbi:hypothetical protein [Nitratireductor soli]|uniref:hypothetical protein n=1 Tax=Nitratireductor soli TaxID=1670619 RepID=UPI001FCD8DCD|nr:hypothetical protein [Nitratireductor soli]